MMMGIAGQQMMNLHLLVQVQPSLELQAFVEHLVDNIVRMFFK